MLGVITEYAQRLVRRMPSSPHDLNTTLCLGFDLALAN